MLPVEAILDREDAASVNVVEQFQTVQQSGWSFSLHWQEELPLMDSVWQKCVIEGRTALTLGATRNRRKPASLPYCLSRIRV
eukprot:323507-Rhodomonas_salina.1